MSALVAGLVAGAVVLLALPPSRSPVDVRVLGVLVVGFGGWALARFGAAEHLPLVGITTAVAWAAYRQVLGRRARAEAERRSIAVVEACDGLAADLRAGQPPMAALQTAAREWPELAVVADAARLGGDVPAALRRLGDRPGARGVDVVAAAWVIAHRSGAGLADAVALAARTVRDQRATARVVETELAAARATGRLLAALPVGVLLIGRGAGGDPFGFLLGSMPGLVCLAAGLSLTGIGLAWLERIARSVQG